jgi:hypothetical protein
VQPIDLIFLSGADIEQLALPDEEILAAVDGAPRAQEWNVRLLDRIFDFEKIRVHSRRRVSRESFARRLEEDLGKPVRAAESWEECLRGADIMVEASRLERPEPLLETRPLPATTATLIRQRSLYRQPELHYSPGQRCESPWPSSTAGSATSSRTRGARGSRSPRRRLPAPTSSSFPSCT